LKAIPMRALVPVIVLFPIVYACTGAPSETVPIEPSVSIPITAGADARVAPERAVKYCQRYGKTPSLADVEPGHSGAADVATYNCVVGSADP
jgi:hypothetical protein